MTKLLRSAAAVLCACALGTLLAAGPALAGSPYTGDPGVALTVGDALGPNYDLWAWVTANVVPAINQGVLWLVGLVLAAAGVKARQWFGVTLTATMQDQIRQTALTGAHVAIAKAEDLADREHLVERAVAWVKEREPAIIGRLGLSDQVLVAIATKMVAAALASRTTAPAA